MGVYVCADANFFSVAAAKKLQQTVEQYNQKIIDNWNSIVSNDDYVVLLGNIGGGNYEEMKYIMENLNGTKLILDHDVRRGNTRLGRDQWLKLGVQPYRFHSTVEGQIKGVNQKIYLLCWNDPLCRKEHYCAAPSSTIESEELLSGNTLNISIEKWNYSPIPYNSIPKLMNNAIVFEEE